MKLLLDEIHTPLISVALAADGIDVLAVAATDSLVGAADEFLLECAFEQQRILVTENIKDFQIISARWTDAGREHPRSAPLGTAQVPEIVKGVSGHGHPGAAGVDADRQRCLAAVSGVVALVLGHRGGAAC